MLNSNTVPSDAPVEIARPTKEDTLGNLQKKMKVVLKKRKPKKESTTNKKAKSGDTGSSALQGLGSYGSDSDSDEAN